MKLVDKILGWKENIVAAEISDSHRLTISKSGYGKTLRYDDVVYSRIMDDSIYTKEYWDFLLPPAFFKERPNMLMIGLGGGTIPYQLYKLMGNNFSLDVVENNEAMIRLFGRFAGPEVKINLIKGDGAEYVKRCRDKYDVIILDAYKGGSVPDVFLTHEFTENANNCLKERGILGINFISSMTGTDIFRSYLAGLKDRFDVYRIETLPYSINYVLLCLKSLGKAEIIDGIKKNMPITQENAYILEGYREMAAL